MLWDEWLGYWFKPFPGLKRNSTVRSQWFGVLRNGTYVVVTKCEGHPRESKKTLGKPWEVEVTISNRQTRLFYYATAAEARAAVYGAGYVRS